MAQYRQYNSSIITTTANNHHHLYTNGGGGASTSSAVASTSNAAVDHVTIGIRGHYKKSHHHRRLKNKRISVGTAITFVCFVFAASAFGFVYLSPFDHSDNDTINVQDEAFREDFLTNVTRLKTPKVKFGHGRDSRYWDGDDRRRDEDYNEDEVYKSSRDSEHESQNDQILVDVKSPAKKPNNNLQRSANHHGLYNEAGRDELRMYEAKYEASLKNVGQMGAVEDVNHGLDDSKLDVENEEIDIDDEYDDGIDSHDTHIDEYDDSRHENLMHSELPKTNFGGHRAYVGEGRILVDQSSTEGSSAKSHSDINRKIRDVSTADGQSYTSSAKRPKKHKKHHSSSTCEMKLLNSTAQLVEPLESRKFARFSLSYTQKEEKPDGVDHWEPRFAGHHSLREREDSFIARDQTINCGFVKGSKEYSGTGFDLAKDDNRYISKCHIAVVSCIFGNSDRLRSPFTKAVSRLSRKNVCFVMFMDESTLQTLSSEGQKPDRMGYIGLWKVVVAKNLPFTDMRRVGKIPKLLTHRLFPSARYSIWLDSKLCLQRDPLLLLENFLWRKGYEYAISNHYDRHCVWEEVERNKKLNKFNHTMIDQQFQFYQADGLKRFNASDPNKLLPSNVPEGSMIIRAHTPMSNLFSCLWFNEVDRFTPRDQLSFAYTYQKLRKKNPTRPFYLHMFKDCERRQIAKLFHHRADERHDIAQVAAE